MQKTIRELGLSARLRHAERCVPSRNPRSVSKNSGMPAPDLGVTRRAAQETNMSLRQIAFYGKGGIGKSTTSQNTLAA
ncbi:MAG: hypothetical protein WAK01_12965, partial [Methylocystis sp.]